MIYNTNLQTNNTNLQEILESVNGLPEASSSGVGIPGTGNKAEIFNDTTNNIASGSYSHAEGYETTASGSYSHAEGRNATALGNYSHAEGGGSQTFAEASGAHAEGMGRAVGSYSHAEGYYTYANSEYSHAQGANTLAFGSCGHAQGLKTISTGSYSSASGAYNIPDVSSSTDNRKYRGVYNSSSTYSTSDVVLYNESQLYVATTSIAANSGTPDQNTNWRLWTGNGKTKCIHVVGNGSNSGRSNAHTLDWSGKAWFAGEVTTTGADYAEYFEWADGNPNNEDRTGHFVSLDGDKIAIADESSDIIGVISAVPAIIGDSYESQWQGKYLTDIYGRIIYEIKPVEYENITLDGNGNEIINKTTVMEKVPKINPEYNVNFAYIPRSDRPEWSPVGFLGKLIVKDDGTCIAGGRCACNKGGIATIGNKYRVLKRLDGSHIQILANFL